MFKRNLNRRKIILQQKIILTILTEIETITNNRPLAFTYEKLGASPNSQTIYFTAEVFALRL